MSLRFAMSSARNPSAVSKQRLTQVQRHFSATTSARQEIQDAYILSAARTPTAKVSTHLHFSPPCTTNPKSNPQVQWRLPLRPGPPTRRRGDQVRAREIQSPRLQDNRRIHGKRTPSFRRPSASASSRDLRRAPKHHRSNDHQQGMRLGPQSRRASCAEHPARSRGSPDSRRHGKHVTGAVVRAEKL